MTSHPTNTTIISALNNAKFMVEMYDHTDQDFAFDHNGVAVCPTSGTIQALSLNGALIRAANEYDNVNWVHLKDLVDTAHNGRTLNPYNKQSVLAALSTTIDYIRQTEWVNKLNTPTTEINMDYGILKNSRFKNADLSGLYMYHSSAENNKFDGSFLIRASFIDTKIRSCSFIESDLRHARFFGSKLTNCSFNGANLSFSEFSGCSFDNVKMSNCILKGANINLDDIEIPVIPNIHQRLSEIIKSNPKRLVMESWVTRGTECGAARCRAGWVVHLAGAPGKNLRDEVGWSMAAALIYQKSDPSLDRIPDFFADSDDAYKDIMKMGGL